MLELPQHPLGRHDFHFLAVRRLRRFHNISLLVDLTRQRAAPPTLTGVFLYIIFFPQLVSGLITRAEMFMPQIKPKYFSDVPFVEAAKWIVTGFFFKLDVANNLNASRGLSGHQAGDRCQPVATPRPHSDRSECSLPCYRHRAGRRELRWTAGVHLTNDQR